MRVLIYGDRAFIRRFTCQSIAGVEMTGISDTVELENRIVAGEADIVLVNGLKHDAVISCEQIKEDCRIPVALLVDEKQASWRRLDYLLVDGFIPEQATGDELKARLQAIWRRSEHNDNKGKKPVL